MLNWEENATKNNYIHIYTLFVTVRELPGPRTSVWCAGPSTALPSGPETTADTLYVCEKCLLNPTDCEELLICQM